MARIRLDKWLSEATGLSRKQAREQIRQRRVSLAEAVLRDPAQIVDSDQPLRWQGQMLQLPGPLYLMLNKPCGVLSARKDAQQTTVLDLLPPEIAQRVHLVGRLDKETTGLLLLTDDGEWSHRIGSPRHAHEKCYRADLAQPLREDAEALFAAGIQLRSESKLTRPARLCRESKTRVRVYLQEGRYHQVRRMFAALGNRVLALHRESIGGLLLDAQLAPGQWRALTTAEQLSVFAKAD